MTKVEVGLLSMHFFRGNMQLRALCLQGEGGSENVKILCVHFEHNISAITQYQIFHDKSLSFSLRLSRIIFSSDCRSSLATISGIPAISVSLTPLLGKTRNGIFVKMLSH